MYHNIEFQGEIRRTSVLFDQKYCLIWSYDNTSFHEKIRKVSIVLAKNAFLGPVVQN